MRYKEKKNIIDIHVHLILHEKHMHAPPLPRNQLNQGQTCFELGEYNRDKLKFHATMAHKFIYVLLTFINPSFTLSIKTMTPLW